MANKKQFTASFNDIFAPTSKEPTIAEKPVDKEKKDDIIRTSFLMNSNTYYSIKAIAHWERCQIKDLVDKALQSIIDSYTEDQLNEIQKSFSKRFK